MLLDRSFYRNFQVDFLPQHPIRHYLFSGRHVPLEVFLAPDYPAHATY
jgi:hypothetical protein